MMDEKTHQDGAELEAAKAVYATINPAWLVSLSSDRKSVIIDGDSFTLDQINAIACLLEHDPEALLK